MYRIAWKSKITGATGHGEYMQKGLAEAWLKEAKKSWGHICLHWLERK